MERIYFDNQTENAIGAVTELLEDIEWTCRRKGYKIISSPNGSWMDIEDIRAALKVLQCLESPRLE